MSGTAQFRIGLYTAPQGTVDPNAFTLRLTATNSALGPAAGLFSGGGAAVVPGAPIGITVAFQIRAWQIAGGATYELATAPGVYRGVSAIGQVTPGDPSGGAPGVLFGTSAGQVLGIVMTPNVSVVPEPSSIALGLLGLGAIALFRRRK